MIFGTYRQYDSRWGNKNYNGSSSYATAACGPTSCANILYAIDPKITPLTTGKFMQTHGYAIRNNGTAWNGIPACLKAFGAKDVRQVDKMADVFNYCAKGYVGVFLFRGGSRGGITWTTSGHYVAITGYKVSNGKHYFKTFDSGGRKHDGWYCYETQMQGLIPRIWLCKVTPKTTPTPQPKPKSNTQYSGAMPSRTIKRGSTGSDVVKWQKFLKWMGYNLEDDGDFGKITEDATKACQKKLGFTGKDVDGIVGPNTIKKAKAYKKSAAKTTTTSTTTAPAQSTPTKKAKCIDVSYWQGKISVENWKKIKKTCDYAICRASYTSQSKFSLSQDSTFDTNFKNAKAAGLKVGAYHYSQAITVDEAKKEAKYLCSILKNYKVDFYVVCDFEYGGRLNSKIGKKASDIANAFCDVVKANGYSPCIYANTSTLNSNLTNPKYPVWVAQYRSNCTYKKSKVMWQYTSSGTIDGISAKNTNNGSNEVDLSYVYNAPAVKPVPKTTASQTTKPQEKKTQPTKPKEVKHSYKIEVDLTNQIATVYDNNKPIMSEFVSTAKKGSTTPTGNFKIQKSGDKPAKARTALMSSKSTYAEFLVRFHGGKCMHTVPWKERQTTGHVYKNEFNKLGKPASSGCVRMPWKLASFIYNNCPIGTPVRVFKGTKGKYPMGKPRKYTATTNVDPTYRK